MTLSVAIALAGWARWKARIDQGLTPRSVIFADRIVKSISDNTGVPLKNIYGHRRRDQEVVPRQIAMYLVRDMTHMSYPRIGKLFGGRDHTTVMWGCKQVQKRMDKYSGFKDTVLKLKGAATAAVE